MNFFGHATVTAELAEGAADPRCVLGSMLPDFASMARTRLKGVGDAETARGVALHHTTDAVFHRLPLFLRLSEQGMTELEAAGVGRGPARATSHVGAELLLDGLLLERGGPGVEAYLGALSTDLAPLGLQARDEEGGARLDDLLRRLRAHGLPDGYRTVEGCQKRLTQALSRRPRLAIGEEEQPAVAAWLRSARVELADGMTGLLAELFEGLRASDAPEAAG